jgi:sugar phosphate isomerase/epimerase
MNPLIMAPTTLPQTPPLDYIAATVAAGYDGIGLRLHRSPGLPFHPVVGNAALVRDIERALAHAGLAVFDIFSFYLQPDTKLEAFRPALELGAELGGKYVMTMGDDPDWPRLCENFARFCDLAGEFGLTAAVEFAVVRPLATLAQTQRLIAEAGRDNAVICIDPLHLARAGEGPDDIRRLDSRLVPYAQITDGELDTGVRHLPGQGSLPLREMLAALPPGLPLSVEGPPARDGIAPAQWASEVLNAARQFLASS